MPRLILSLILIVSFFSGVILPIFGLSYFSPEVALSARRDSDEDDDEDEIAQREIEEIERKKREAERSREALNKEIAEQEKKLNEVSGQKKSLETEVKTLDASRAKIETNIKKTQTNINISNLTIEKLAIEVNKQEEKINTNKRALGDSIRSLQRLDATSPIELYLNGQSITSVVSAIEDIDRVQNAIRNSSIEIASLKEDLVEKMQLTESEKEELEQLTAKLSGEKQAVLSTKQQKDQLLSVTKSKESEYQALLQQKIAQRALLDKALQEYESQINIIINRDKFPTEGTAVLAWPLDSIIITQHFGSSEFAKKNPAVYGGRAYHPGTDFGASIGTTLKAPLSGTVTHTGNTDAIAGCYSWGKWILLKHDNGLTSLFAHLSVIGVKPGDRVKTGDPLGNTGNTGYSTGPHLHYTLYASEGVQVVPFSNVRSTTSCAGTVTPTAPPDAYLDPLDYLPKL